MGLPRQERRRGFTDVARIVLLEDDADRAEKRQDRIESKLDNIRNWLVTGAVSFGFACVLLAINLVVSLLGTG